MYVDTSTVKTSSGKSHTRYLLRESFRENGKVKHRTIANISDCTVEEIAAIKLALKHKKDLQLLGAAHNDVTVKQGLSFGAVWSLHEVAKRLGIAKALGSSREGKLAMWQVLSRVIDQGSRLSAVRLASSHAACDVLGLGAFNEDDLYDNLNWLALNQERIEKSLYEERKKAVSSTIFLYDVTSSYFEGTKNELARFGYNRDKKKGKRQVVIGLLCDEQGHPLSIEVFAGNTQDQQTFASQLEKAKLRFGAKAVTFVGDRGMIKSQQVSDLLSNGFHYVTAITKPQIEKLLNENVLQMSLFDQELAEVITKDETRYVLRRNPVRALEIAENRNEKLAALSNYVNKSNDYLATHRKASAAIAFKKCKNKCDKLRLGDWVSLTLTDRSIDIVTDEEVKKESTKLDGCYVIKTDLLASLATKETIHHRYKDLASVERAFRSSKTAHLEIRPIYLINEQRTKAHALVVMLAYKIISQFAQYWKNFDMTVEEGISKLTSLCLHEVLVKNNSAFSQVPMPRNEIKALIEAAKIILPKAIKASGVKVSTKKKLQSERIL